MDQIFRKLNKADSTARVLSYLEHDNEVLTHQAKKRVQRMMHYSVPLRPFVATIEVRGSREGRNNKMPSSSNSFGNYQNNHDNIAYARLGRNESQEDASFAEESSSVFTDDSDSPFMCTPKSFPPTPSSRAHVLARGTRFAEDVVFLARDHLRVEEGLDSKNEQTRAMAAALREGSRLAIFNAADVCAGISLTCGQHCASKVGNDLYCSARGMIPLQRNCYVYFEMSVSTPPLLSMMLHHASLSIGLATLEMPLNALVGAWKGSIGLCSTGQILAGSQWFSPLQPKTYGSSSTVGCLVYLDDESAFETWDGVMVSASVVFNVNGDVTCPATATVGDDINNRGGGEEEDANGNSTSSLSLFVPREEELFPTLTLHSSQTEVLCRFCAEDILANSRDNIGAPRGHMVFSVDGSVIFDEGMDRLNSEDDSNLSSTSSSQSLRSCDINLDM